MLLIGISQSRWALMIRRDYGQGYLNCSLVCEVSVVPPCSTDLKNSKRNPSWGKRASESGFFYPCRSSNVSTASACTALVDNHCSKSGPVSEFPYSECGCTYSSRGHPNLYTQVSTECPIFSPILVQTDPHPRHRPSWDIVRPQSRNLGAETEEFEPICRHRGG
jgi:hypothetical protein